MLKEHDGPKEPAERRATRKWKNNEVRQKIIASKVAAPVVVDPNAPPDVATVIVNKAKRRPGGFERKFLKEIRSILGERKEENLELIRASLRHQRRRLFLEKLRRLELSVAESEKRIAERQNATKSKDLFA
jgi:hypothetical protein